MLQYYNMHAVKSHRVAAVSACVTDRQTDRMLATLADVKANLT